MILVNEKLVYFITKFLSSIFNVSCFNIILNNILLFGYL